MAILGEIEMMRGDSYPLGMRFIDKSTGDPLDITGYTFELVVDERKEPTDETTQLFSVAGIIDPDQVANTGKFTFLPTIIDTDQIPGRYWYDIQMLYGPGHIYKKTIKHTKFTIVQDLNKD